MDSTDSESFDPEESQETAGPSVPGLDPVRSSWKLLLALGFGGILISVSFNFFLFNQNRLLERQHHQQSEELKRVEQVKGGLQALVQDVVNFSAQHPEVRGILTKHGVKFVDLPTPVPQPPSRP